MRCSLVLATLVSGCIAVGPGLAAEPDLVQFGKMHEAIGQKQHQGRVRLEAVTKQPHFYGVAALKGLAGEVTIVDGKITATVVGDDGEPQPLAENLGALQATMLVGAYVKGWKAVKTEASVPAEDFDAYVAEVAKRAGRDPNDPFVFQIRGKLTDVRMHIIHGACPIHARIRMIKLPAEQRPFAAELKAVEGTVVGVYARGRVGDLTHPTSATHSHLVFKDPASGVWLTGHLEQVGLAQGAVVSIPK